MRRFVLNLFRFTPRRLLYLVATLAFLLMAVVHDSIWILGMILTAFMYKARKPRNEIINPAMEETLQKLHDRNPDVLLQQYHDDLGIK